MKPWTNCFGRVEIFFMKSKCAKFYFIYMYLSTSELMFRIACHLAYWSLRYNDMKVYQFLIRSLGCLYFENTKQGNSCAQLAMYPFQSLHNIYIQVQTCSYLSRSNVDASRGSFGCSSPWIIHVHEHHSKSHLCGCMKLFIPLKQKEKETYERHSC